MMQTRPRPRASLTVFLVLLLAASGVWAASWGGTFLVVTSELEAPEAILSLGSHEWERLPEAARLALENPDSVLLLSEPREPNEYNCHLCGERVGWLVNLGVPRERTVVLPQRVVNTYDEAVAAREYSAEEGITRLMVVTSPYHTRRAFAVFRTVFAGSMTMVGVRPALRDSPARPDTWWWQPYDRSYVRYETAALVWYALRHRVNPLRVSGL